MATVKVRCSVWPGATTRVGVDRAADDPRLQADLWPATTPPPAPAGGGACRADRPGRGSRSAARRARRTVPQLVTVTWPRPRWSAAAPSGAGGGTATWVQCTAADRWSAAPPVATGGGSRPDGRDDQLVERAAAPPTSTSKAAAARGEPGREGGTSPGPGPRPKAEVGSGAAGGGCRRPAIRYSVVGVLEEHARRASWPVAPESMRDQQRRVSARRRRQGRRRRAAGHPEQLVDARAEVGGRRSPGRP